MVSKNDLLLCAVRSYGNLRNFLDTTYSTVSTIYKAVLTAFEPSYWIFFKSKLYPVPLQQISFSAQGSMMPEWTFDATSLRFAPLIQGEHPTTTFAMAQGRLRIPILSMNIMSKNRTLYDLTDFVESLRISYVKGLHNATPTIAQLLGAWSINSGAVLDWSQGLFVTLINQNGIEIGVPYNKIHTPCGDYNISPSETVVAKEEDIVTEDAVTAITEDTGTATPTPFDTLSKEDIPPSSPVKEE